MFRTIGLLVLLISGVAALIFTLPRPDLPEGAQSGLAIRDVRAFDGAALSAPQIVVIEDSIITAIGESAAIPAGARVIDGDGLTALPGLIDAHTHTWGQGLEAALDFGVTAHLDMFSAAMMLPDSRAAREDKSVISAADLFSAGMIATSPDGHGTQFGVPVETLSAPEEAAAWVAARKREGSDYIKLVYMPGAARFGGLDLATAEAVIDAAHEEGLMALAHISSQDGARDMVAAGVNGLVHIFADTPVDDAFIAQALEADIFIIPTLAVIASAAGTGAGAALADDPRVSERLSAAARRGLEGGFGIPPSRVFQYPLAEANVRRLHAAGVTILAGSDAPNPGTAYGASLHHEMALLVDAGLPPGAAIAAASVQAADRFGLRDRGRLAPGARADLLLVRGDPTGDIAGTLDIEAVVRNGRWLGSGDAPIGPETARLADADISAFDRPTNGFAWMATTDAMMGGASEADIRAEAGLLRAEYAVRPGFAFPWAGLGYLPADPAAPGLNLSDFDTLVLRLRASPGAYRIMVFTPGSSGAPPTVVVNLTETFSEMRVDLGAVEGFDRTAFAGLAVVGGPQVSEGFIELEQARFEPAE